MKIVYKEDKAARLEMLRARGLDDDPNTPWETYYDPNEADDWMKYWKDYHIKPLGCDKASYLTTLSVGAAISTAMYLLY